MSAVKYFVDYYSVFRYNRKNITNKFERKICCNGYKITNVIKLKKLLEKLHEAEEAVKAGNGWLTMDELKNEIL